MGKQSKPYILNSPEAVLEAFYAERDPAYRAFQLKLLPTVAPESVIGVRTPALRAMAKAMRGTPAAAELLKALPHGIFEANQLHAFLISELRDFEEAARETDRFLPFVDNWATCDQLSPRAFGKNREALLPYIDRWLGSGYVYTVRFGVRMLMDHFLGDAFSPEYPARVAGVRSGEYYIDMMAAWYFATALAKQYEAVLPLIEARRLPVWTHNRAIQKAVESRRITDEQKAYLRTLKIR